MAEVNVGAVQLLHLLRKWRRYVSFTQLWIYPPGDRQDQACWSRGFHGSSGRFLSESFWRAPIKMHTISKVLVPTVALLNGTVLSCSLPCRPHSSRHRRAVAAAGLVAGAVEGGIAAAHGKRDIRQFNSSIKRRQDVSNLGVGTTWSDCTSEQRLH